MNKIYKVLTVIGLAALITLMYFTLSAFTTKPAEVTYSLTKVTSRDGISVYNYSDYVVVTYNGSVSISR
jgi:hypothetical protein